VSDTTQVVDSLFAHVSAVGTLRLITDAAGQTVVLGSEAEAAGIRRVQFQPGGGVSAVSGYAVDASAMSAALTLDGSGGADTLVGGGGNDLIVGDTLLGSSGYPGNGNDSIDGGAGSDTVVFRRSARSPWLTR
jgi:Ca2+-binding RTX toxin-like protein